MLLSDIRIFTARETKYNISPAQVGSLLEPTNSQGREIVQQIQVLTRMKWGHHFRPVKKSSCYSTQISKTAANISQAES